MESLTLRPIVRAWTVASDHTVLVARDAVSSELAALPSPSREYRQVAELALPAYRIVAAAGGWLWLRSWPARIADRAGYRPFGRQLMVLSPAGVVTRVLTLDGALTQIVVAGELVLVATSGGALSAFDPSGGHLWSHAVPGWPATPEQRVWASPGGGRVWVSERGGITELDGVGAVRWSWAAPAAGDATSEPGRRQAAELLRIPLDSSPTTVRRAFRRRAKETHPDHHPEEPEAEQRFRAVANAYRVLLQRQPSPAHRLVDSGRLEISGVWPCGPDQAWVATCSGTWHLLDGGGREREQGRLSRHAPVRLAVTAVGDLVAAGGPGELRLAHGGLVPIPVDWEYELRATPAGIVAHGREGLMLVTGDGAVAQSRLLRPAQAEWVGDDLYLLYAEGDFWRVTFGNPAPPAAPPSRRRG